MNDDEKSVLANLIYSEIEKKYCAGVDFDTDQQEDKKIYSTLLKKFIVWIVIEKQ